MYTRLVSDIEQARDTASLELDALSRDQQLAKEAALKVFENVKKGLDLTVRRYNDKINYTYTVFDDGRLYYEPILFRFYLGKDQLQFNHNFQEYWKKLHPLCEKGGWDKAFDTHHAFLKLVAEKLKPNLDQYFTGSDLNYRIHLRNCKCLGEHKPSRSFSYYKYSYQVNSLDVIFWKSVRVGSPLCCSCFPNKADIERKEDVVNRILVKGSVEDQTQDEESEYFEYKVYDNEGSSGKGCDRTLKTRVLVKLDGENGYSDQVDSFYEKDADIDKEINGYSLIRPKKEDPSDNSTPVDYSDIL